ncbi:phosphodiester glycosidase family protein [Bacillus cereus]|uniref:Uncharacterized protein n=1 Tax=Bacillus cereus TaxID=1396 RepID=A0A2A7I3G2_BACCE|nr:phosphodiester glycosidase family protein [Bacillus cereus]PEC23634.1 hypothetical protein COM96_02060 [Bacillus cereus]
MIKNIFSLLLTLATITFCVVPSFVQSSTVHAVTSQEQSNGIEYVNEKLGFSLKIPDFWKDHYIVEENDQGGVIFKFKFEGKVYNDIYLFNIYVVNKEYSNEEQEELGDNSVLGIGNGKTYLVTENLAMYASPQAFDKYFSSVPKEGRNVIEAMSKQKKILNFNVLEGSTVGKAELNEEGLKGSPAEEAKEEKPKGETAKETKEENNVPEEVALSIKQTSVYNWLKKWISSIAKPANENFDYEFFEIKGEALPKVNDRPQYSSIYVIKTPADNIRSEIIKEPVSKSKYMGINGGFFDSQNYQKTPTDGRSIAYNAGGGEHYDYNETSENPIIRPNFVTYFDKKLQKTQVKIIRAKDMKKVREEFEDYQQIKTAIGGVSHSRKVWGDEYYEKTPDRRTVLGYKEEKGTVYAYLIITRFPLTIANLKEHALNKLELDEYILLDGSGSTSMRVKKPDGTWLIDKGRELNSIDADRHVYNMVRLINTNVKKD